MKSIFRVVLLVFITAVLAGGLIWGFRTGRGEQGEQAAEADCESSVKASSRVSTENGQTVLAFGSDAQSERHSHYGSRANEAARHGSGNGSSRSNTTASRS